MVRFKGTAARESFLLDSRRTSIDVWWTEAWSPYVALFTTSLPRSIAPCKVFPDSDTHNFSTWTPLPANSGNSPTSVWACKARRFWPVRVVCEGPAETDIVPGTAPDVPPPERRRKRRDTFQKEIDLDAELRERERAEAMELKNNTDLNSLTNSQLVKLKVDTDVPRAKPSEKDDAPRSADSQLSTPTILASLQQLGQSVAAAVTPAVQSLPSRISDLKEWFAQRQLPAPFSEDIEREEEELERRKREKRRRRREKERRKREEVELAAGVGDEQAAEELEREQEERRKRGEERRRRRAEEEGRV